MLDILLILGFYTIYCTLRFVCDGNDFLLAYQSVAASKIIALVIRSTLLFDSLHTPLRRNLCALCVCVHMSAG